MSLMEAFEATSGSTAGKSHRTFPNLLNNQDAVGYEVSPSLIVGCASDGCGSQPHSSYGAETTVNQLLRLISRLYKPGQPLDDAWFAHLYTSLVKGIVGVTNVTFRDPKKALNTHMLATAGGVIMTPEDTTFFGAGDFEFGFNDEAFSWEPEEGNKPLYPVLSLAFPRDPRFKFRVHTVPTAQIMRLYFGTDGAKELRKVCADPDEYIPGTDDPVGPFDQIWTNGKFYADPTADNLGIWLNSLAQNVRMQGPPHHGGLLGDDTTIFAARRKEDVSA